MAGARLHDLQAPVYNAPPSEMQHCVTTVGRNTPAALRYTHTGSNDAGIPELAEQGVWQWRSAAGMRPHPAGNNRVHTYDAPSAEMGHCFIAACSSTRAVVCYTRANNDYAGLHELVAREMPCYGSATVNNGRCGRLAAAAPTSTHMCVTSLLGEGHVSQTYT